MGEKLRLKIQYTYSDSEGKEKKASKTYSNIKSDASDENLLKAGKELEKLSSKAVEGIIKLSEKKLN